MSSRARRAGRRRLLSLIGSILILSGLLPVAAAAPVLANDVVQSLPLAQNWSDTSLITVSDDWSGVPGIVGYRGDGLTSVAGVDPQTVLADGSTTPIDVNANITNPSGFGDGGVIEAEITDPTIALQGSAIARAPHLVISLTTVGLSGINVAYNLRDIDASSDNTTMALALQYRVGSSGAYTNVPAGFVADASTGGTATKVTPVNAGLPAAVNNQPLVQVRILMTDAPSTDEMIGVDDISITSQELAPSVVSTPANGAIDVPIDTTPTLTFSEEVTLDGAGVSLTCTNQGPKAVTVNGGPSLFSLATPTFLNGDHCTLSVLATAVSDLDSNDPPDNMAANFSASFDIVAAVTSTIVINEVDYDQPSTDTAEYVELKNTGTSGVNLDTYNLLLVNGTGGGAAIYDTIDLPEVTLAAGDYFVVCANAATVANCDLDDAPDTNFIQNGNPDAVGLQIGSTVVDALSYGGVTGGGFTENAGAGTDAPTEGLVQGLSRCPDGTDTNNNSLDFLLRSSTPGTHNTCPGDDVAPIVQSTFPVDGATDVGISANLTVTFSEPVTVTDPWFTITCNGIGKPATSAGGPTTFTIDPEADFVDGDVCQLTVVAANVADLDADDPPDNLALDFVVGFTAQDVCLDPFTPIYSIQGSGSAAAITGNVTTQGVVVGDFQGPITAGIQGLYIQDADGDGDAATSDGIFVFTGDADNGIAVGDVLRVTGFARERFNQTALNGSNSNTAPVTNIVNCGSGSVTPAEVTLPFETLTFPERYEGMLVRLPQALVVSEYFNYERFGELVLAQPLPGEDRPFTPTAIVEPGAPAQARAADNLRSRITLDDGLGSQNPPIVRHPNGDPFSLSNRFRGGDTVTNTVGVMGFDFSLYRIHPTAPAEYTSLNPRTAAPDDVGGTLRAAAMNTLNFFLTLDTTASDSGPGPCGGNQNLDCRGADADQPMEFTRQRDKLLQALAGLDADIIGLNELENTPGVDPLGDETRGIVPGLNAMGVGPYAAIDTGVIGTDAIRVGLIYRSDVVAPVGDFKILNSSVDPRFIDTRSRPVLAQTFEDLATGARITVAVNHLKSKGSACTGTAAPPLPDPDTGDGQGNCPLTRTLAAQALVDWLATDPTGSGDRDYLILGDLNSYAKEDPIDAIKAGPDDDPGTADDYTNLIETYLGSHAYSFVFDGQAGYLDHALASPTLAGQVTGATEWHINADEPDLLDYDTTFKPPEQDAIYEPNANRSSDHDPVIVGLDLLNYEFSGFEDPVDNPPVLNEVKAGQGVPVKFRLADGLGLDVLFGMPTATQVTCGGGGATDPLEATTPGSSGLQLDPQTGLYTYVWKTDKQWVNQCRTFEITFDDGAYRQALFSLK